MYKIFVVSDGTGRTAKQALNAALTQFEKINVEIIIRPNVRTEQKVRQIVQEAKEESGFIVHTLVADVMRDTMIHYGRRQNVETIDLMGPLLARLSHQFAMTPSEKPGLFSQLNKNYFRRIETMEFARLCNVEISSGIFSDESPESSFINSSLICLAAAAVKVTTHISFGEIPSSFIRYAILLTI